MQIVNEPRIIALSVQNASNLNNYYLTHKTQENVDLTTSTTTPIFPTTEEVLDGKSIIDTAIPQNNNIPTTNAQILAESPVSQGTTDQAVNIAVPPTMNESIFDTPTDNKVSTSNISQTSIINEPAVSTTSAPFDVNNKDINIPSTTPNSKVDAKNILSQIAEMISGLESTLIAARKLYEMEAQKSTIYQPKNQLTDNQNVVNVTPATPDILPASNTRTLPPIDSSNMFDTNNVPNMFDEPPKTI
jgi:hypothetical protein